MRGKFRPEGHLGIPELSPGEAHVWIARLDALCGHAEAATGILDETERARAANFRFDRDRLLYMLGRMTLRRLLSAYLGTEPADVPLRVGPYGKPELGSPFDTAPLHFNVSHSGDLALYAITRDGPVGIDVEQIRPIADLQGVAELVLSPREKAAFSALRMGDRQAFFHEAWARKEAYLKALGDGLMRPPTSIEFGALLGERGETIRDREDEAASDRWRVAAWQPEEGYWASLVTTIFTRNTAILDIAR
ncbi:4'-phosphopantetheinyl transferase family protein [Sphingomonas sp. PR090111-T3T-6A]|uniref:4'-phosphopantetheinyl transferase family protein n=1 Tax=Sphingomonas sp. PR090111-T3T-6A TaxID=685778 RepID=UPI00138AB014|nr:4'-phosphopantetheinyl transferase superfamily protein [Sphingomonas sp. PR090111-T3T-6A]